MKCHGFSRVEMLLVLGVTGVAAALLLPALAESVQENAGETPAQDQRSQCQSHLKQIALGMMLYTLDYDESYPPVASASPGTYGWADLLLPYTKSAELYQCPSEKHGANSNPRQPGYTDYWYNRNLAGLSLARIDYPTRTLLLGDGDGGARNATARYTLNALPRSWVETPGSPARRHLGGADYAYADGHVKWLKPQRVTTASPSPGKEIMNTFAIR